MSKTNKTYEYESSIILALKDTPKGDVSIKFLKNRDAKYLDGKWVNLPQSGSLKYKLGRVDADFSFNAPLESKLKGEGYHLAKIKKGELGEISKITEEYEEFIDAQNQSNPIMGLIELSDLLGAMESYVDSHFSLSLNDLINMKNVTQRAFKNGYRT